MSDTPQVSRILKRDAFGRIELLEGPRGRVVRRVVQGRVPGAGFLGGRLLARERRALAHLGGTGDVPALVEDTSYLEARGHEPLPGPRRCLLRSYLPGVALWEATELPRDFFDRLEERVLALHRAGVCHNDLGKENNVLVLEDGRPGLVDFQLASLHPRRGRTFERRAREDLRHVEKHRRRYDLAAGTTPRPVRARGTVARLWRVSGKPLLRFLTHRILRIEDGEPRRPHAGPWPERTPVTDPGHAAGRIRSTEGDAGRGARGSCP